MTDKLEFHPLASLFPLMEGEEFEDLKKDIAENGLLEPGLTFEGKLIDGRNRYRACQELGISFPTKGLETDTPLTYIVSVNLHRRHLTSGQRAIISLDALPLLEVEAKVRLVTSTGGAEPRPTEIFPEAEKGEARAKAADLFQTNPHYVSDVKMLKQEAPDLIDEIMSGDMSIEKAKKELKKRTGKTPEKRQQPVEIFPQAEPDPAEEQVNPYHDLFSSLPPEEIELLKGDHVVFALPYDLSELSQSLSKQLKDVEFQELSWLVDHANQEELSIGF